MSWNTLHIEQVNDGSILRFSASARAASLVVIDCLKSMGKDVTDQDSTTWVAEPPVSADELKILYGACRNNNTPLTFLSGQKTQEVE